MQCYFLGIKRELSIAFRFQIDSQTKKQNSWMEAYLRAFFNWEQDNWARLLPIAEFAYKNAKNASTNHTPFQVNYSYYPRVSFKEDVDSCSKSWFADMLIEELKALVEVSCRNFLHVQNLQKRGHDIKVKNRNYTLGKKV